MSGLAGCLFLVAVGVIVEDDAGDWKWGVFVFEVLGFFISKKGGKGWMIEREDRIVIGYKGTGKSVDLTEYGMTGCRVA